MTKFLGSSYELRIVKLSYFIFWMLSIISFLLSLFVYESVWSLISHPTLSIFGIIVTALGLRWSDRNLPLASMLLVSLLMASILMTIFFSLTDGQLIPFVTGTFSLSLPIVLSGLLFEKEKVPLTAAVIIVALIALSYLNYGNLPEGINQTSYYLYNATWEILWL